jgi:flagellar hook assembly protein FlgD
VPAPTFVQLKICDIQGRLVRTLVSGHRAAGLYRIQWEGKNNQGAGAASGIYLVQLESPRGIRTERVVLLK